MYLHIILKCVECMKCRESEFVLRFFDRQTLFCTPCLSCVESFVVMVSVLVCVDVLCCFVDAAWASKCAPWLCGAIPTVTDPHDFHQYLHRKRQNPPRQRTKPHLRQPHRYFSRLLRLSRKGNDRYRVLP